MLFSAASTVTKKYTFGLNFPNIWHLLHEEFTLKHFIFCALWHEEEQRGWENTFGFSLLKIRKKHKSLIITWYLTQGLRVRSFSFYRPCPESWSMVTNNLLAAVSCPLNLEAASSVQITVYKLYLYIKLCMWVKLSTLLWTVSCKVPYQTPFACARHFPPHIQALRRKFQLTLLFFLFMCLNILKEFFFFWVLLWIGHNSL